MRNYYFRKLARYLQPGEYRRVAHLRSATQPQITIPELLYLRWAIRRCRPHTVVEIGSYCGASTYLMADALQQLGAGRLYAIDLFAHAHALAQYGRDYPDLFDETMRPYAGWIHKIQGDSGAVPWERPIDLLFIDGDHSEAGVSRDLEKYAPFVRSGGCVLLHDYVDEPKTTSCVKPVVDRTLMRDSAYSRLGRVGSLVAFRKSRA